MDRKTLIIALSVSGILLALALSLSWSHHSHSTIDHATPTERSQPTDQQTSNQAPRVNGPFRENEQIIASSLSKAEIGSEVTRRDRLDPKWECRMAVLFCGKVVHEPS